MESFCQNLNNKTEETAFVSVKNMLKMSNRSENLHIVVIGGGAAGFMAAVTAKMCYKGANVTILERGVTTLAKVGITGGGRCNITNTFADVKDLKQVYPRGFRLLKKLFHTFGPQDTRQWFEERGLKMVEEDNGRLFPVSQQASDVVALLQQTAYRLGVVCKLQHSVVQLLQNENNTWTLTTKQGKQFVAHKVAVTTGGAAHHPLYDSLQTLGHTVVKPIASLFTLTINDKRLRERMGVSVRDVVVSLTGSKHRVAGDLLITHWGMSGPAILKLSSMAARELHGCGYRCRLSVNWMGDVGIEETHQRLMEKMAGQAKKMMVNVAIEPLTLRIWQLLLERAGIAPDKRWGELGKKERNRLVETLTNDGYEVCGKGAYKEEFVMCGGVSLSDINPTTLESKHSPNLYFAGEVLDIDALTGGYNLQAAWTTGYIVGKNIVNG